MLYTSATLQAELAKARLDVLGRRMLNRDPLHFREENVEMVGEANVSIANVAFDGGTVGLRLNKCDGFHVSNCSAAGQWNPMLARNKPGNDGHCFQAINCGGTFHYCWGYANNGHSNPRGTLGSEDLFNVWGDEPETEAKHVIIELCHTYRRSPSPSCTHICIDGPHPPKVTVLQNSGMQPRCYITIGGGCNHDIQMNASYGADTDLYLADYYKTGRVMNGITVRRNSFPRGVLIDKDTKLGPNCHFQIPTIVA